MSRDSHSRILSNNLKRNLFLAFSLVLLLSLLWPLAQGRSPFELGIDLSGGAMVTYRPDFESVPERHAGLPRAGLMAMAKETLTGRLMQRFETLPDVVIRDDGRLVVSLPGEHDQRRVLETLGQTYRLTFRQALAVHETAPDQPRGLLLPYEGRWLDLGDELLSGEALDPHSIRVDFGGGGLESLGQGAGVSFAFSPPHDERFAEITRDSVGKTLAILLDQRVEWAGRVEQEIRGPGSLRGGYTVEQASEIAGLLRSGNLPLSLEIESLSAVGPGLGQEILDRGELALGSCVALLALLILLAYGHRPALLLTGWVSLGFLLLFTLGLISLLGLTVDLVAIAGLVLSIGMGMDAFILVFEALERRSASGPDLSADTPLSQLRRIYSFAGEGRTLLHANATTALVVVLLLASDRLKSFALFLIVGLAASILTILVTRYLLAFWARRGWLESSPGSGRRWRDPFASLRNARPGLLRYRRFYFAAVVIFLLAAASSLQLRAAGPWLVLGADFQPGMQLQLSLPPGPTIEDLAHSLRADFPGVEARYQARTSDAGQDGGYLLTLEGREWQGSDWTVPARRPPGAGEAGGLLTPGRLAEWLLVQQVEVEHMHSIDARLSGRRMLGSLSVLIVSFALLGLYLAFLQPRLDRWLAAASDRQISVGRGIFVGTVLAVAVDLVLVLAALAWLEIPIGMPVIAALLTIVGYSVNDSMVLACHLSSPTGGDRRTQAERLTEGVDKILSRAVLTSLSTMLPAVTILAVGLEPLHGFAWAILVGTVAGTLSSMFLVASFAGSPSLGPLPEIAAEASPREAI